MRQSLNILSLSLLAVVLLPFLAAAQQNMSGIDPAAIMERMIAAEERQRDKLEDVILDAEYIEGEMDEGQFVETIRFEKKIYIKYLEDTALYFEEYLAYYKDGEKQSQEELEKQAKERKEKKRKRNARDISYNMLQPFFPQYRDDYEVVYQGVTNVEVEGYICHQFTVISRMEDDEHINGTYYVEPESFHLVRVDFEPAKLVKKTMFKLNELNMSIRYAPTDEGFWLPRQFDVAGRGKAALFFGVRFAGTEYYRNPIVNSGVSDEIFEVRDGD